MLLLGVAGVLGLLVGGLSSGFTLAVFMANAGGAWDNAKKYVEDGNYGGPGSECHKATIVGDTVGDPFKDTSGPSLNILIKLMSMVSIVMAGLAILFWQQLIWIMKYLNRCYYIIKIDLKYKIYLLLEHSTNSFVPSYIFSFFLVILHFQLYRIYLIDL